MGALTRIHLDAFKNNSYTGVLINHHETSTGVLYNLDLIKSFCKLNQSILVIDAISSFISDEIDMYALKADAIIISSHKALALPPGLSIVTLSPKAIKKIQAQSSGTYYGDFKTALANGLRGQTPFTPAVNIILQLHARLKKISTAGLLSERIRLQGLPLTLERGSKILILILLQNRYQILLHQLCPPEAQLIRYMKLCGVIIIFWFVQVVDPESTLC